MCLTERQTDYVYKTVEEGNFINRKTMTQETMLNQDDNPHKKVVLNKVFREEDKSPEMRNWSIFIDLGIYPDILKSKYLDMYEGVYTEMVYANKFNENSDLSTTHLGQTQMTKDTKIKAEEKFPITSQGFASGNCWMEQIVKFCWTWVPQNLTCQNLTICNAKLYMHY